MIYGKALLLILFGVVGHVIIYCLYQKILVFFIAAVIAAAVAAYFYVSKITAKLPEVVQNMTFGDWIGSILCCLVGGVSMFAFLVLSNVLGGGIADAIFRNNDAEVLYNSNIILIIDLICSIIFTLYLFIDLNKTRPMPQQPTEPEQPYRQQTQQQNPQQPEPNPFANLIENFAQATQQQPAQPEPTQEFIKRLDDFFQNYQPPLPPTPKPSRVAEYRREYQPTAYRKYRSYLSKEELGKRYERYCGYLLEKDGWEVEYSGIVRGQKDEGIDLRAYSQGRMVAAQCKFWGSGRGAVIRSKTISQFIGDLDREVSENPSLQVIGIFFAKNNNFDTGCKERLESKGFWVQIKDYDNQYPCVKCIAASGLYYVPQHREYDNLRFSIHRGDRHCDDEAEAEKLGFREAE